MRQHLGEKRSNVRVIGVPEGEREDRAGAQIADSRSLANSKQDECETNLTGHIANS